MSADLTGSHLDAATGRDEEPAAGDGEDGDDSDDDDEDGAGARAARQATKIVKAGGEGGGGDGGGASAADRGGAAGAAAAPGGGEAGAEGGGAGAAGLDGEVKEMERNKLVRTFFRGLLKEWEMDLNARPDHVKRTVQGKLETKTQKQAKDYMRPLFKLCKQKVWTSRTCVVWCEVFCGPIFLNSAVCDLCENACEHVLCEIRGFWSCGDRKMPAFVSLSIFTFGRLECNLTFVEGCLTIFCLKRCVATHVLAPVIAAEACAVSWYACDLS